MSSIVYKLGHDSEWMLPKAFVKELGLKQGFLLCDLIEKHSVCQEQKVLTEDQFFTYLREDMLKVHDVNPGTLRKMLQQLCDLQLIDHEIRRENGPSKVSYFRVNSIKVRQLIDQYVKSLNKIE